MQLRDYQAAAVDAGVACLNGGGGPGLIVTPCGGGKGHIQAAIASRMAEPTLVLQPSRELVLQNEEKLLLMGVKPAVFSASCNRKETADITLATIGSIIRKPEVFGRFKNVIVDECDVICAGSGQYKQLLDAMPGARVVGMTATPYRLATNRFGSVLRFLTRTRPRVFERVIHYTQNKELFDRGYLCPLEYKQVKTGFNPAKLRINSTGSDYTDESVKLHFKALHFSDQIVRCVNRCRELGRGPVLVFTRFVEEAEYVAAKVEGARVVSAKTPDAERKEIIKGFKAGVIPAVMNCQVLTCGFDYPALQNVILARPTMSLRLYYQMVGRCVRTAPGKESAFVIDMVGLVEKFGRVEDLRLCHEPSKKGLWCVWNHERQLTNVYFPRGQ